MKKSIYYTYVLLDTRKPGNFKYGRYKFSYQPFYIGKGKGDRVFDHLSGKSSNPIVSRKINKIRKSGLQPVVKMQSVKITEQEAHSLEIKLIANIGRLNIKTGPLCNFTDGGEGCSGRIVTKESREKCSISNKSYWNNLTDSEKRDHRERMREMQSSISEETRNRIYEKRIETVSKRDPNLTRKFNEHNSELRLAWNESLTDLDQIRLFTAKSKGQSRRQLLNPHTADVVSKIKNSVSNSWANLTPEQYAQRCKNMSEGRLRKKSGV